jgi:hypothetical protein
MELVAQLDDSSTTFVISLSVWVVVFGFLSGLVYQSRGGTFGTGFLFGALLGIFGLIIVAIISPSQARPPQEFTRKCPHCLQDIPAGAAVCYQCGRESEAWIWRDNLWWTREGGKWFWFNVQTGQWVEVEAPPEAPPAQQQAQT